MQAIRRKDWTPTSNSYLCSEHFEKCFVVRPNKIGRRLYYWAGPSIFNFPSHLPPKQQKARQARKRPAESSVGNNVVELHNVPSPAKVARRLSTEHCYAS